MDLRASLTSRLPGPAAKAVDKMDYAVHEIGTLVRAGIIGPIRPGTLMRIAREYMRWGPTPALGSAVTAIHYPDQAAIADEIGSLTFEETHARSNAIARALRDEGITDEDGVAIMCRNHRYFVEATVACSKIGANALYLNTSFAGPQLADVIGREGPAALIHDEEFTELLSGAAGGLRRFVAWGESSNGGATTLEDLIAGSPKGDLDPPEDHSRFVILTSGTTGTPKGANRPQPEGLSPLASFLSKIPMRSRQTAVIAAPLFHSWGFANFILGMPLAATTVLKRRFDPEETLKAVAEHRARALVVVPVMMQRILDLPEETRRKYDVSSLEVTGASGSALPGELAIKWMDEFGDNVYNLYGSTELAWATIATPEDLRAAPGTAGKVPRGTVVKLYDAGGNPIDEAKGETGRIFVGNDLAFESYTGGGSKDEIDGLMSAGDVGHFDEAGRLFIDGRDDEMIVSGGENVFPREVEDLLSDHEAVNEAAAVGVEDEQFGQRLKAFVALEQGKDADEDELKSYVKAHLARYKVPREIEFLDELPRNATGKVVKRDLVD